MAHGKRPREETTEAPFIYLHNREDVLIQKRPRNSRYKSLAKMFRMDDFIFGHDGNLNGEQNENRAT